MTSFMIFFWICAPIANLAVVGANRRMRMFSVDDLIDLMIFVTLAIMFIGLGILPGGQS
jgi:hypothetical protein